jgi:hypothetical protein
MPHIHVLGLSDDNKANGTPIAQWSPLLFRQSLLSAYYLTTAFTDEIMTSMLSEDRYQEFADYVVDHMLLMKVDFI